MIKQVGIVLDDCRKTPAHAVHPVILCFDEEQFWQTLDMIEALKGEINLAFITWESTMIHGRQGESIMAELVKKLTETDAYKYIAWEKVEQIIASQSLSGTSNLISTWFEFLHGKCGMTRSEALSLIRNMRRD